MEIRKMATSSRRCHQIITRGNKDFSNSTRSLLFGVLCCAFSGNGFQAFHHSEDETGSYQANATKYAPQ
jgi:hypothetical protein